MKLFRNRCAVQHELIFATINRTLYSLLLEQQDVLSRISFPMFSQEFNDSLSKYALTNKIMTHNNTNSKVPFDMNMEKVIKMQSQLACAVLSIRINAAIDTRNKLQHDYKLSRNVSMNSENSTEPATPTDSVDYYSQDAKKRRKKRRLSNQKVVDQIMNSSGQLVGNSRINPEADSESLPLLQKLASMIKSSKQ